MDGWMSSPCSYMTNHKFCDCTINLDLFPVNCVEASMNSLNQIWNANLSSTQTQLSLEAQEIKYHNKCVLCEWTGSTVPLPPPSTGSKSLTFDLPDINYYTPTVWRGNCMAVQLKVLLNIWTQFFVCSFPIEIRWGGIY